MRIGLVLGLCIVFDMAIAHADDLQSAKQHYDRGTTLYDLQHYKEAAHEYELAYEAKHDPALLFNIGQAYRLGGEYAKAIGAYRAFLRHVPDASNRAEVEQRISEMQLLLEEQKRVGERPPPGIATPDSKPEPTKPATTAPDIAKTASPTIDSTLTITKAPTSKPIYKRWYLWVAVASVVVVAVGAGVGIALGTKTTSYPNATVSDGTFRF